MNLFRVLNVMLACICCLPIIPAGAATVPVYKGELSVEIPWQQPSNTLVLSYRTKMREVLRIGVRDLVLTNMATRKITRLNDSSAGLGNHIEAGYWNTDIMYDNLALDNAEYRVEGRITFYLSASQQSRRFRVQLKSGPDRRPDNSSIDWGVDAPGMQQRE